jgi:hypothetical protein
MGKDLLIPIERSGKNINRATNNSDILLTIIESNESILRTPTDLYISSRRRG